MKDRDVLFHEKWLGLAQPSEGLIFSVPALADAQIAPELRAELTASFEEQLDTNDVPRIRDLKTFLRDFLGYDQSGMLVPRAELPAELSFYAAEGGQELRPSFAIGRGPFTSDDLFAAFSDKTPTAALPGDAPATQRWSALIWDLTESGADLDLDEPEATTGPWRYPPTSKLDRLLRHVGIPVGLLFTGRNLRLVYAPAGESTGHLTFRVEHLRRPDGRPLLAALDLLLHARRAYGASKEHTLEGLLAESRRRQADVTEKLAKQVFEAVEILVAGFEAAAVRDCNGDRIDWLRAALEAEGDHFYQGVLTLVLRFVFLLYSEDQSLLPVEHPVYAEHMSLGALYARLEHDAGAHPESMHHRFGAYGQLLSLFRAVFFGVRHRGLELPPRRGRLFDPNAYPFLEGGLPDWTAAVVDPAARAAVVPPSLDDGTIYRVLHRLVVFQGQRLSYRALDVEQIGSVYESLMGYHVLRLTSAAVRIGDHEVWVETDAVRSMSASDRARCFKETCGLNPGPTASLEKAIKEASGDENALLEALSVQATGRRADLPRHRARSGQLVLQPGAERRRTGSHYTPRTLTEKIVKRTLEPLLACLGDKRTPEQILQLKICDPAMGSGAFLVATCRELASEIVAAWTRQGELAHIIEQHGDAHLHARRLVAQKCLYGVDKNAAAVELAKLSLWLVTLSRALPFTFVDHALRHGDSLVGLDFRQIEAFHWKPAAQTETCRVLLKEALDQAVDLRQQILALADREDPVSQTEKRRLFEFSQQAIDRVRIVADACVGAFFAETKDAAREKERKRRLALAESWFGGDGARAESARVELSRLAEESKKKLAPFHWWIEFPEVFFDERPDPLQGGVINGAALMEGVVGNPPFLTGKTISTEHGDEYLSWLGRLYPGSMSADICAYFFRRAATLLGEHGAFGLIATKTIAEGDTRIAGLRALVADRWQLYDATDSMKWPGPAAVVVSIVHGARGRPSQRAERRLDGAVVGVVNSRLRPKPERPDPSALLANSGAAYVGTYLLSMGFTLAQEEHDELASNPSNVERLFPYIGGEELNTSPTQAFDRYTINFDRMDLAEAKKWPELLKIVEERVRPERATNKRDRYREIWWQFAEPQTALRDALATIDRCLVTARHQKHWCVSFQPSARIFSEGTCVFPLDRFSAFAILQSRVHESWARLLSSSLKTDLRYSASKCFETFPFPTPHPRMVTDALEGIGARTHETRARYMIAAQEGLTKTYNAITDPACDDPRIVELRRLHEEMDRAVLDAYGWTDVAVPPYCPLTDADRAAVQGFEDEVIDRLYVLNAERAAEEARVDASRKRAGDTRGAPDEAASVPKKRDKSKRKKSPENQGDLF